MSHFPLLVNSSKTKTMNEGEGEQEKPGKISVAVDDDVFNDSEGETKETNVYEGEQKHELEFESSSENEWEESETLNCYVCSRIIDDEDFSTSNIKQTSFGLMHVQCQNKLLISNIPNSINDDALYKLFSSFGSVLEAQVHESHGLIEFESKASAKKSMNEMNGFAIGTNKLSVKYAHVDDKHPQSQKQHAKNYKSRYVHSKESLRSLSAIKLCNLLNPESKKYKKMNKKWMRLIIQHQQNEKVIEFIYNSKANDATNDFIYGYVAIPSYLELLIDQETTEYFRNQKRPSWLPSQHVIIVSGYIRTKIEKRMQYKYNWIIPAVIIEICFKYYVPNMSFFVLEPNLLLQFDIEQKTKKVIIPKGAGLDLYSCVCIPGIEQSHLPNLSQVMDKNTTYLGIFGRDRAHSQIHFILKQNMRDIMTFSADYVKACSEFIYCGKHGIITLASDGMYQLKLQNIKTENYKFTKLSKLGLEGWGDSKDLSLCFLNGLDKIFVIQTGISNFRSKCCIFDLSTRKWHKISAFPTSFHLDYGVAMAYNYHTRSSVYVLSVNGALEKYDLHQNKWERISCFENFECSQKACNAKPILWLSNTNVNILYCALLGQKFEFHSIDLRMKNKKWTPCSDWNEMMNGQNGYTWTVRLNNALQRMPEPQLFFFEKTVK